MKKLTQDEVIKRFKQIHKNKYKYNKVKYISGKNKVEIICPKHGSWLQTPDDHYHGHGCMQCRNEKLSVLKYDLNTLINKSNKKHNNKYDYSLIKEYKGITNSIKIICKIHNEKFNTNFHKHLLNKGGCRKCQYEENRNKQVNIYTTEKFILDSKSIHGNKYDYSKVKYTKNINKVEIICPKHGSFFQTPNAHKDNKQGCPCCKESKGEKCIRTFLEDNIINYIPQYSYINCKFNRKLFFDFYLPDYNICIEFDGKQHYEPCEWFSKISFKYSFEDQKVKDKIKNEYCIKNNIKLIRIPYYKIKQINKILKINLNIL